MKMQSLLAIMALGLTFAMSTPVYAEFLDRAAAEKLLKGNTIEGEDSKFGRTVKIYFDPDGIYKRVDDLNNKEDGTWKIEPDGKLCMITSKHMGNCRSIQPGKKEGKYRFIKEGKKGLKVDKVLPGNPYNL